VQALRDLVTDDVELRACACELGTLVELGKVRPAVPELVQRGVELLDHEQIVE
jgi:hypothetical protein